MTLNIHAVCGARVQPSLNITQSALQRKKI
jgi:hypothetical protein